MEIKNRLFPYPVLCADTDDYVESVDFTIEPHIDPKINEFIISMDFEIHCDSLEKLIREGKAEYVLHIECSTTAFRTALRSGVPSIEYNLRKEKVNGEINLVAMIVAKTNIQNYFSDELNEDYSGETICIKKGGILAYQNLPPIYVKKKTDELVNNGSLFTVIKQKSIDVEEVKPLTFNLNNDKILIYVDEKTYDSYVKLQSNQSVAMTLLVLPAITYMLSEVSYEENNFEQYEWYQRMSRHFEVNGKSLVEEARNNNPVALAQEMIRNPISTTYTDLVKMGG